MKQPSWGDPDFPETFNRSVRWSELVSAGWQSRYASLGVAERTVVLLPGGVGRAEFWFGQAKPLSARFRVLIPEYPQASSLSAVVESVLAMLDAERIRSAHLVGTSLGGMIAEVLSREAPGRVASLTLSSSGLPDAGDKAALERSLRIVRSAPWPVLRLAVHRRMARLLRGSADADFWLSRFDALYRDRTSRDRLMSQQRVLLDLADRQPALSATPPWEGPCQLLWASDDRLITEQQRLRLAAGHPLAVRREFSSGGHLLPLTRLEYIHVLTNFLP